MLTCLIIVISLYCSRGTLTHSSNHFRCTLLNSFHALARKKKTINYCGFMVVVVVVVVVGNL